MSRVTCSKQYTYITSELDMYSLHSSQASTTKTNRLRSTTFYLKIRRETSGKPNKSANMNSPVYSLGSPSYRSHSPRRSPVPLRLSIDSTQYSAGHPTYSPQYSPTSGDYLPSSPQYSLTSPGYTYSPGYPYSSRQNSYSSRQGSYGSDQYYDRSRRNALASPTHSPAGYISGSNSPGYHHNETSPYNSMPGSPYSHTETSSVIGQVSSTPIFSTVDWHDESGSRRSSYGRLDSSQWPRTPEYASNPASPLSNTPIFSPVYYHNSSCPASPYSPYLAPFSPVYDSRPVSPLTTQHLSTETSDALKFLQEMVVRAEGVLESERIVEMIGRLEGELREEFEKAEGVYSRRGSLDAGIEEEIEGGSFYDEF